MPFAGELLRVREEAVRVGRCRGTAAKELRTVAYLVADSQYKRVAEWVDSDQTLKGRLVYFRTRERRAPLPELAS